MGHYCSGSVAHDGEKSIIMNFKLSTVEPVGPISFVLSFTMTTNNSCLANLELYIHLTLITVKYDVNHELMTAFGRSGRPDIIESQFLKVHRIVP